MLETAETTQTLEPAQYDALEPELRTNMVQMQQRLRTSGFPVLIVISGDDAAGVRDLMGLMSQWMDPRSVQTRVFADPDQTQQIRPEAWRYWTALPPAGSIGVYSDEWFTHHLAQRLENEIGPARLEEYLDAANRYERMLVEDGAVILKLFVHQTTQGLKKQRKRFRREAQWSDVARIGRAMLKHPVRSRKVIERAIQHTSTEFAPWHLINGADAGSREVAAARLLMDTVRARTERPPVSHAATVPVMAELAGRRTVLDNVDLVKRMADDVYKQRMSRLRKDLARLTDRARRKGISVVAAFEGWDASGKGGTIRRLTETMAPENYRVVPISAPTDEEKVHHYLWRFWRHIPADGGFVIFDRSWYGRVLVERIEGFARVQEWSRAYEEINYFEQQLTEHGIIVLKFWLHISKEEQLRRFEDRQNTPFKQFKIGPDDYRNREKWDQYVSAVEEMVARTSTPDAPWRLIPSDDKKLGRVEVLKEVAEAIGERV